MQSHRIILQSPWHTSSVTLYVRDGVGYVTAPDFGRLFGKSKGTVYKIVRKIAEDIPELSADSPLLSSKQRMFVNLANVERHARKQHGWDGDEFMAPFHRAMDGSRGEKREERPVDDTLELNFNLAKLFKARAEEALEKYTRDRVELIDQELEKYRAEKKRKCDQELREYADRQMESFVISFTEEERDEEDDSRESKARGVEELVQRMIREKEECQ